THVSGVVIVGEGEGVKRIQPPMIGMAALVRSPDGQFIGCRFHGHILPSFGIAVQCNVVCLSLTSGYAGRQGTSPIALLRDAGGGRKHQSRSTESFPDSRAPDIAALFSRFPVIFCESEGAEGGPKPVRFFGRSFSMAGYGHYS